MLYQKAQALSWEVYPGHAAGTVAKITVSSLKGRPILFLRCPV